MSASCSVHAANKGSDVCFRQPTEAVADTRASAIRLWIQDPLINFVVSLGSGDQRGGKFLRLVQHHVMTAGETEELPASIFLETLAELVKR